MKITDVKTMWLSVPTELSWLSRPLGNVTRVHKSWDYVIAHVEAEDGSTGMGYAWTPAYGPGVMKCLVDEVLKDVLIGQDVFDIERSWRRMWAETNYYGRRGLAIFGITILDMAVWDLVGILTEKPLHKILGAFTDRVPVYATGGFVSYTLEELQREAETKLLEGFRGYKMFVGQPDVRKDLKRVAAVRRVIGDDAMLMLDINQACKTAGDAVNLIQRLEQFNPYWVEEPVPADLPSQCANVRQRVRIPIASGENAYTKFDASALLKEEAVDVLQPDIFRAGGITEWLKIASLAESFGVQVAPHIATEVCLPLMASVPNAFMLEYLYVFDFDIFADSPKLEDGCYVVSDRPGHGVRFSQETVDRFRVA